jgi:hypothetical protein
MPRRAVPSYSFDHAATPVADSVQPLLEALRTELTKSARSDELEREVQRLTHERSALVERIERLEQHVAGQQQHVVHALTELRGSVRERVRALDGELRLAQARTSEHLESLLQSLESGVTTPTLESRHYAVPNTVPTRTVTDFPPAQPSAAHQPQEKKRWKIWKKKAASSPSIAYAHSPLLEKPVRTNAYSESESVSEKKPKSKKQKVRALTFRSIGLTILAVALWQGWTFITPESTIGGVAGATTLAETVQPSTDPYAESYAELPFAATEWKSFSSTEFGVELDYPKNTSNIMYNSGGSNVWFLRRNGFLLKFTKIETNIPLDAWWNANQTSYLTSTTRIAKTTFKGMSAYSVYSAQKTPTSGTSYFVQGNGSIFEVWVKDEPATTDDGKRLERMVETLKLIPTS